MFLSDLQKSKYIKIIKTYVMSEFIFFIGFICILSACDMNSEEPIKMDDNSGDEAKITAVSYTGEANNYTFNVTIASPDTGCDQYADWWEVFSEEGVLIARRILGHSHVNEQPFTRSKSGIDVGADDKIFIRAHMNNLGYGTTVFSGTIHNGLNTSILEKSHANDLETTEPLPTDCAF